MLEDGSFGRALRIGRQAAGCNYLTFRGMASRMTLNRMPCASNTPTDTMAMPKPPITPGDSPRKTQAKMAIWTSIVLLMAADSTAARRRSEAFPA